MNLPLLTPRSRQRKMDQWLRLLGCITCAVSLTGRAHAQEAAAPSDSTGLKSLYGIAWDKDRQPELADFSAWAQAEMKAQKTGSVGSVPDAATVATGVRLAERRRFVMAALVQTDPARALAVGVPPAVRAKLPSEVVSHLETPFSATGDYSVDRQAGRRQITVNGRVYSAHVYGRRTDLASLRGVFLHGFLLDGEAALDADVLRALPANSADSRLLVDGGGTVYRFDSLAQIQRAETDLRTLETHPAGANADAGEKATLGGTPGVALAQPAATGIRKARAPRPQDLHGNDFFANAYQLTGSSGTVFDNNIGDSSEPGEPRAAGVGGGATVWYVWTPTETGEATFTTDDNEGHYAVDTVLAAYTGSNVSALSEVASNDDYDGYNSQITFFATAGVTYHITVDGYDYSTGTSEGNYTLTYLQQGSVNTPSINSSTAELAEVNSRFSYTITATNSPTSYGATGLPTGLSLNAATGVISGRLTTLGVYTVVLSATNDFGAGSAVLELTVTDQPIHFSFFTSEIALPESPGIYYLHLVGGNVFGYYAYLTNANYIYHLDLGYEYTFDAGDGLNGIYFYDFASDTFFYTSPAFPFPYLYDFKLNTVLYYYHSPTDDTRFNTNGIRYFYDFATDRVITK